MTSPRHDYDQFIAGWITRPDGDQGARPQDRVGLMRAGMESTLRDAGLDGEALARELAHFDAAAMRFLRGQPVPGSFAPQPMRVAREPLGLWGSLGNAWISAGFGMGAFGLISALLMPLKEAGRLDMMQVVVPSAIIALVVFVAGLHAVGNLIRRYREVGFVLFWLPAIVGTTVINSGLFTLPRLGIESMGADFLPLALPLAGGAGGGLILLSLWLIWRSRTGTVSIEERDAIHPLMALLLTGFSLLFFTIGAQVLFGWGNGPSLVVGLLVTSLLMRLFREREISWWFAPVVALPLSLFAAEMPPSGSAALTVLLIALVAGALAWAWSLLRDQRHSTLFTSLTAAALALLLVIAPTGPAPALWAAETLGHPLKPLGEATMKAFVSVYRTEFGRSALAAVDGYRTVSAVALAGGFSYDATTRRYLLVIDITNAGEAGIVRVNIPQSRMIGPGSGPCRLPVTEHVFKTPLWPGDTEFISVEGAIPDGCNGTDLKAQVAKDFAGRNSPRITVPILETRNVDPSARFREDARVWLRL